MALEGGIKLKSFEANFKWARPVFLSVGLALIGAGAGIIGSSWIQYSIDKMFGFEDEVVNIYIGIGSIVVGVAIALLGGYLARLRKERIEFDIKHYHYLKGFISDIQFDNIYDSLYNENAIFNEDYKLFRIYWEELKNERKKFLTPSLKKSIDTLESSMRNLIGCITINFRHLPSNVGSNARLHLKPMWNIDFADSVSQKDSIKYDEISDQKDELIKTVKSNYNDFRLNARKELKIND